MRFEPIAIVGQACVLPGALTPAELWDAVREGRDLLSAVPDGYWRLDKQSVLAAPDSQAHDQTWTDRGGYVRGFRERFDSQGFAIPSEEIEGLDPLFHWVLHGIREALHSARMGTPHPADRPPIGLVLGNLSYPTFGLVQFAESVWSKSQALGIPPALLATPDIGQPDPRNRFSAGLPAHLAAKALNLRGEAFALDAACASSLYAIKLACDRLQDRRYDVMVAGAVNRTDDLFIHIGFCALQAMSRRGQSRPFAADADGLIPAEGAAFIVLKRLVDAVAGGDEILGVIRGIGLSNDGNSGGFLSPAAQGQVRAMDAAYAMAGLSPTDISLLECHATGTPVGDAVEIQSASQIFHNAVDLPIGSLKSNLGHLITAAGLAGLLKVLGGLRSAIRPPSRPVEEALPSLADSPFRILQTAEPWPTTNSTPRRAAISAFGFGGNNAHLIVEEWNPAAKESAQLVQGIDLGTDRLQPTSATTAQGTIAIVDLEVTAGNFKSSEEFLRALFDGHGGFTLNSIDIGLTDLRFPPNDLKQALPQQLLIFELARRLAARNAQLPLESTAVLIGMGCDPEIARYSVRWRLDEWAKILAAQGQPLSESWIQSAKAALVPELRAAGVVGTMPNIPANRINTQLNCLGPSFVVASEELSGIRALECAMDALRHGEIGAALVGAVDLSDEVVHRSAALSLLGAQRQPSGDAAVVLLLKRVEDAQRQGDSILATIDANSIAQMSTVLPEGSETPHDYNRFEFGLAKGLPSLTASFGHAHAASGLLHVATAALCLRHRARLIADAVGRLQPAAPWLSTSPRSAHVQIQALGEQSSELSLYEGTKKPALAPSEAVGLRVFSGATASDVLRALDRNEESSVGPARLVVVTHGAQEVRVQIDLAKEALAQLMSAGQSTTTKPQKLHTGVYWCSTPVDGQLGFVFAGAAATYQGMGRELLLALPELGERVVEKFPTLVRAQHWLESGSQQSVTDPFELLQGSCLLSQIHAILTQEWLGLKPNAVMGVSSGETNAVFATGAWHDMDAMFAEIEDSGMYSREIAGEYRAAQRAWMDRGIDRIEWTGWRVLAPVKDVEEASRAEEYAYLTMINAPADCLIAGQADACLRVVNRIGQHRCVQNVGEIIAHHPVLKSWEREWHAIHSRQTQPTDGVRFYSNALGASYTPTRATIADALTDQATSAVDFRRVVDAAWEDGVRIFLEHGPRNVCSGWIRSILGEREHLVIALDRPQNGVDQLLDAVAQLMAAGVSLNHNAITEKLFMPEYKPEPALGVSSRVLTFPAHFPPVELPPLPQQIDAQPEAVAHIVARIGQAPNQASAAWKTNIPTMQPPPPLPPVLAIVPDDQAPVQSNVPVAHALTEAENPYMQPAPALPPVLKLNQQDQVRAEPVGGVTETAPKVVGSPTRASLPSQESSSLSSIPQPVRAQMVDQLAQFHNSVSAAHQVFLGQQERATTRLLALRAATGAATDRSFTPFSTQPQGPQSAPTAEPSPISAIPATEETPAPAELSPASHSGRELAQGDEQGLASLPGPKLNRKQLEKIASDKISEVLGPIFARQDHFERQVRMPMPPLLLADRVLGIDAEAGAIGHKGIIWTETDVREDSWYLHQGHVPTGIMIESGQADLLLVSYLGADFLNKGERVYRLLGCEVTFHRGLATIGDTLHYEIHIDGYAQQGPVRLFFFHYDCTIGGKLAFSVRHGQAGFFTDEELANSGGVLWDPLTAEYAEDARVDLPALPCATSSFSVDQVIAFSEGRVSDCFGETFRATDQHVRTPTIARGRMLLIDEVTTFDPGGGPWGRGYLCAQDYLAVDEWFFEGHFKNDPCMPGTLMYEGCLQTMSFYLTAMGYTLDRDGWRFEPVPEETYKLICRGQVIPGDKTVTYELFVEELIGGPVPTLYADLLVTVDGLPAFHCRRMGMRLIPAYPLEARLSLLSVPELSDSEPERNARSQDHVYDPFSIAACAWGKPSDAFGQSFARFDGPLRCPRLPGPPYLFMTRITSIDAQEGLPVAGGVLEAEYQIPREAWYFAENGDRTMPYSVLLEAALQPCGWFASYKGSVLAIDEELFFRNLDGTATLYRQYFPDDGILRTRVKCSSASRMGSMTIMGFEVESFISGELVFSMSTSFGFFPQEALASQVGLPVTDADRTSLSEPDNFRLELRSRPPRYCSGELRLPGPMLLLLDRISGYWPDGGRSGLGRVRAEIDVDPHDWFFKCHFMGDPVQPGSLGLEAMLQTLQFYMMESELGIGIERPRFEPIQLGKAITWKFRGQVLPTATRVTIELEITERVQTSRQLSQDISPSAYAVASASLWVDGIRIYEASGIGMRIVSGGSRLGAGTLWARRAQDDTVLDPARDRWLQDHCPTWTVPALAMMSMVDRLAAGALLRAPGRKVTGLRNLLVHRWLGFAGGAQRLEVFGAPQRSDMVAMQLMVWEEERNRYSTVASGEVLVAEDWQLGGHVWKPLQYTHVIPNPYSSGILFHGPAYQLLTDLHMGDHGSTSWLDLDSSRVPLGTLNQALLDAATHGIPHDALWQWCPEIPKDVAAYPVAIPEAHFYGPTPTTGLVRCEARFADFRAGDRNYPMIRLQLIVNDRVWAEFELVEALFPKGPIGQADPLARRAFLRDRTFVAGLALSQFDGVQTSLAPAQVKASDWLAGTVAWAYAIDSNGSSTDLDRITREVAVKEHVARKLEVHPAELQVEDVGPGSVSDSGTAEWPTTLTAKVTSRSRPFTCFAVCARREGESWHVVDADSDVEQESLDLRPVRDFWRTHLNSGSTLVEDLTMALLRRFIRRVEIADPEAFYAQRGRGVLYLANHQMDLESILFVLLLPALQDSVTTAVARQELTDSWINTFLRVCFHHPNIADPNILLLIDRSSPQNVLESLQGALDHVCVDHSSLLVHVEGERSLSARQPVQIASTTLIDLAVAREVPIVPVRFVGGLPIEPVSEPLEFPLGYGQQDVWIGTPILAGTLAAQSSAQRKITVLNALNGFNGRWRQEQPIPSKDSFATSVTNWRQMHPVSEIQAALFRALESSENSSAETRRLLSALLDDATRFAPTAGDDAITRWLHLCSRDLFGIPLPSNAL